MQFLGFAHHQGGDDIQHDISSLSSPPRLACLTLACPPKPALPLSFHLIRPKIAAIILTLLLFTPHSQAPAILGPLPPIPITLTQISTITIYTLRQLPNQSPCLSSASPSPHQSILNVATGSLYQRKSLQAAPPLTTPASHVRGAGVPTMAYKARAGLTCRVCGLLAGL